MLRPSLRVRQAAQHITRIEFLDATSRVHPAALHHGHQRVGIAVSGGSDSMALAAMCKHYLPQDSVQLHALIIDHGLRDSSTEEAKWTAHELRSKLGLHTHVEKVKPEYFTRLEKPKHHESVETSARSARLDLFTKTSKLQKCDSVFLAHHQDDLHETILYRLSIFGRRQLGIRELNTIESASVLESDVFTSPEYHRTLWNSPSTSRCFGIHGIADSSIILTRPLLRFSKERLRATCRHFGLTWVEDATNLDQTFTPRNAIRHIIANHQMPKALSKEALINMSDRLSARDMVVEEISAALFELTKMKLDVRTSSLAVRLPMIADMTLLAQKFRSQTFQLDTRNMDLVIHRYLSKLNNLVSSHSLGNGILNEVHNLFASDTTLHKTFATSRVMYYAQPDGQWILSGEPPRRAENFQIQAIDKLPVQVNIAGGWYLRIDAPEASGRLELRFLNKDLMQLLRYTRSQGIIYQDVTDTSGASQDLDAQFKSLLSPQMRWKLPVIVWTPSESFSNFSGQTQARYIVAFPTLNLRAAGSNLATEAEWIKNLQWKIFYKDIKLHGKRLQDILVVPTMHD